MLSNKPASLQDKIELFLRNNRVVLAVLTFLIIAAIISVVVGISVGRSVSDREAARLYDLETAFAEWLESLDPENPEAGEMLASFADFDFRNNGYAHFRKIFLLGLVYEEIGEYQSAADNFSQASQARGYLGATSLLKAGLMLEAAGDIDGAISSLQTLVSEYDNSEEPRVKFTIGRLFETKGEYENAADQYRSLIAEHSASGWSDFAQNRLIALTVDGVIQD